MKSPYQVILQPVITEKGLLAKEEDAKRRGAPRSGQLVFKVATKATKTEIKEAVENVFKVKVASVRTSVFVGKERRRGKFAGFRPDWKKAYVRLKTGEKMPEYAQNL
jgi:large subunit ribosomal protein L23